MKNIEVVIHINENLNSKFRNSLSEKVSNIEGVISTGLIDQLPHLMIVGFDSEQTKSLHVLDGVRKNGVHAQLVGWL
jgi:hypothetical protein